MDMGIGMFMLYNFSSLKICLEHLGGDEIYRNIENAGCADFLRKRLEQNFPTEFDMSA